MSIKDAINARHSVRQYQDREIPSEIVGLLNKEISECNSQGDLNIQLLMNDPQPFNSFLFHYGKFVGVNNYLALVGKKTADIEEKIGYYGERIVLKAQSLGLNTCWVALTYNKRKAKALINKGEKLVCVISIGYGNTQGNPRKSKTIVEVANIDEFSPAWFISGVEAALLAPTALNQQKFKFNYKGNKVSLKSTGGFYSKIDLGIVKYHFEVGAGVENFQWVDSK
ncbi:MAG: nitroreductase family protein [Candidatus Cloacimonetes bacterium]|nr:nitroreductase family protein [Candidatus Cloacimonadota bacterium]